MSAWPDVGLRADGRLGERRMQRRVRLRRVRAASVDAGHGSYGSGPPGADGSHRDVGRVRSGCGLPARAYRLWRTVTEHVRTPSVGGPDAWRSDVHGPLRECAAGRRAQRHLPASRDYLSEGMVVEAEADLQRL